MKKIFTVIRFMVVLTIFIFVPFGVYAQDTHTDIIPTGSTVKKLSTGQFSLTEGPVWYRDSILLFTSNNNNVGNIYSYNSVENKFSVFRESIYANGLTCDRDGNLLSTNSHRVVMLNKVGEITKALAETFNNKVFNGPNDLIADNKGGVYFTDPLYFDSAIQDKEAVYYIDSAGEVKRIIDDLIKPNGVILSPDGKKLYVADSNTKYVYSWEVASDGSLSGKSIFAELEASNGIVMGADGMAIDIHGNLYAASEKGIQIFSSQGTYITSITVPEVALNCDFGGKDFKTLYITGLNNLYSIDLNYPGYTVSRRNLSTAINSISKKSLVEIYPNPTRGFLYIQHNLGKVKSIEIFNLEGKKASIQITKQQDRGFELNTQSLKAGMYLLRIISDAGVVTRKFVKD